jgi:ribose 5-phosphate isomerase B
MKKILYIGADHAGFKMKEKIKKQLVKIGYDVKDMGGDGTKGDDYPDFAFAVANKVSKDINSRGILICGSGTGMVIAANRIKGVRAMVGYDKYSVKMGRLHNDSNVLCLRSRKFSGRKNIKLVKSWLDWGFSGVDRHIRRIKKLERGK